MRRAHTMKKKNAHLAWRAPAWEALALTLAPKRALRSALTSLGPVWEALALGGPKTPAWEAPA